MRLRIEKDGVLVLLDQDGRPVARVTNVEQNMPITRVWYRDPISHKDISMMFPGRAECLKLNVVPLDPAERLEFDVSPEYQQQHEERDEKFAFTMSNLVRWTDEGRFKDLEESLEKKEEV